MLLYGVQHTEVPNLGVTLFDGYSYHGLNAFIGVQHTEVPNLGVTLFDGYSYHGLNAVIGVQHTEVPNLGPGGNAFGSHSDDGVSVFFKKFISQTLLLRVLDIQIS